MTGLQASLRRRRTRTESPPRLIASSSQVDDSGTGVLTTNRCWLSPSDPGSPKAMNPSASVPLQMFSVNEMLANVPNAIL